MTAFVNSITTPAINETWLPIPSFTGYEASDMGRVRNSHGRVLRPTISNKGYLRITLIAKGKKKGTYVQRLVCEAFHGPAPFAGAFALHTTDPDKTNNHAWNLEWGSSKRNWQDFRTQKDGKRDLSRKMTADTVREMRSLYPKVGMYKLAEKFGVSPDQVRNIVTYKHWKHID